MIEKTKDSKEDTISDVHLYTCTNLVPKRHGSKNGPCEGQKVATGNTIQLRFIKTHILALAATDTGEHHGVVPTLRME